MPKPLPFSGLFSLCVLTLFSLTQGEPSTSALSFNFLGWSLGKSGPGAGIPERTFYPEPAFLTMSEVGELSFGALDLDMTMRSLTHWVYGAATDSADDTGLDHAYITVNKGYFIMNEGKPGPFDWGLGLDFDWRRANLLPRSGHPSTLALSILGTGIVTRFKMNAGNHFLLSPALAYDAYALPRNERKWITGHGLRADCDIWVSAWPGGYTLTLQPFWHWHIWNGSNAGLVFHNVTTRTFGIKVGIGTRPVAFIPSY